MDASTIIILINAYKKIVVTIDLMSTRFLNKKYPVKNTGCNRMSTINPPFIEIIQLTPEVNSFNPDISRLDITEFSIQIIPRHKTGIRITYFRYKCKNFSKVDAGKVKSKIELYLFNEYSNKQGAMASINMRSHITKPP